MTPVKEIPHPHGCPGCVRKWPCMNSYCLDPYWIWCESAWCGNWPPAPGQLVWKKSEALRSWRSSIEANIFSLKQAGEDTSGLERDYYALAERIRALNPEVAKVVNLSPLPSTLPSGEVDGL